MKYSINDILKPPATRFLLILIVYLIFVTLFYIQISRNDYFFQNPQVDEKSNLVNAEKIYSGQLSKDIFWQEPGTYLYLSLLKSVGIETPREIKFFQLFLINPLIMVAVFLFFQLVIPQYALRAMALYALIPLPWFLAATIMKTTITTLLYLLCFLFFFKFKNRSNYRNGIGFVLFWFLSWWFRQHIILFLPVFFYYLYKKETPLEMESHRAPRSVVIPIVLLILISLTGVSIIHQKPMATLTTNGPVNFFIANNPHYLDTVNMWPGAEWTHMDFQVEHGEIRPYSFVMHHPLDWLGLIIKKATWEFTPYYDFRIYSWSYFEKIFPYFKSGWILNLLITSLALLSFLAWKRMKPAVKIVALVWLIYHLINILFIPGIARYNAIILPLTIVLASVTASRLMRNKPITLLFVVLSILLVFNRAPNDFKDEYMHYLRVYNTVHGGEAIPELKIPDPTRHTIDWKYLEARNEYNKGNYEEALHLIKDNINDFHLYGLDVNELVQDSLYNLRLYYDALMINQLFKAGPKWPARKTQKIHTGIFFDTERMLQAYRRLNQLIPLKANMIASYLATLPESVTRGNEQRFERLLQLALEITKEALLATDADTRKICYDTLGIVYFRMGAAQQARDAFNKALSLMDDSLERDNYRRKRNL